MKNYSLLIAVGLALAGAALFFYFQQGGDAPAPQRPLAESGQSPEQPSPTVAAGQGTSAPQEEKQPDAAAGQAPANPPEQAAALPQEPAAPEVSATLSVPLPPIKPSFDIVRVEKDGSLVIAGRGAPQAEIQVVEESGEVLAEARNDDRGEFVALPERRLGPGQHRLSLRSRGPGDAEWQGSEQSVVIVVPEQETASNQAGSGGGEATAAPSAPLAVLVPSEEGKAPRVLQGNLGEGISAGDLALEIIDYDAEGNLIVGGSAPAGSRLLIYLDNEAVGDTRAAADGRWQFSPGAAVEPGNHLLRVDQIDAAGKVVARVESPFYRAEDLEPLKNESFVVVQPGNSLWRLSRRAYGEGLRYTLIFEANKEQIRDPDLIYPGQIFLIPEGQAIQ